MKKIILIVEGGIFVGTLSLMLSFVSALAQGIRNDMGGEWLSILWVFGIAPVTFLFFVPFVMKVQWRIAKVDYWLFGAVLLSCMFIFNAWGMHSFALQAAASSFGAIVVMLLGSVRFRRLSSGQ